MVAAPPVTCANHRRRSRVAICGACGNGLCADCVVHTGVGVKCPTCTGMKAGRAGKGSAPAGGAGARERAGAGAGRRPWAVPLVVIGALVLVVAGFGLLSRGADPEVVTEEVRGEPAAFTDRQTEFVGAGGQRIGGTLTLPGAGVADGRPVPAVLIISGLGALDRNSVVAASPPDAVRDALVSTVTGKAVGSGDPLFRDVSESLAKAGVASFRYDRRGTATIPLRDGQKLSFDDEVADARAALDLLSKRQEQGGAPLAVLGHDTGAVVAMRVAAGNARVRAIVAVSMASRPMGEVLAADLGRARGPAVADAFRAAAATLASSGKAPPAESLPEIIRPVFASGHDAYLADIFKANPVAEVGNVAQPVLLVRGGGDPAVTGADVERMSPSLRTGGQVMVGSATANHNLTLATAAHEHSNSVSAVVSNRDADAASGLTAWVKVNLGG